MVELKNQNQDLKSNLESMGGFETRVKDLSAVIEKLERESSEQVEALEALSLELQEANFEKNRIKNVIKGEKGFEQLRGIVEKLQ